MVHISERETELPDAVISKLLQIAAEDRNVLSLGPGEPDFPLSPELIKATQEAAKDCNHYSPAGGRKDLKEALVKKLKKENNITASEDNIIVTTGSQEAILLATACTLDVSEQIIVPDPSFLGYLPTFELLNAFPIRLELKEDEQWNINPDRLKKLIDRKKTKAILINTPANPTGNVISKKILEEIADIAIDNNVYIYSDEAYEKIIFDKKHISVGSLNGMQKNVITFHTFSKTYAMCGFRVGYAVGPMNLIEAMKKSHIYTTLCAPTISQIVAKKALEIGAAYTEQMRKEYASRKEYLVKRLNEIGLPTINPQGAFYTFSNIASVRGESFKFAHDLLQKEKVAVVPGKEFGVYGEGYIRCSYATARPTIEKAMERLERYVKKNRR